MSNSEESIKVGDYVEIVEHDHNFASVFPLGFIGKVTATGFNEVYFEDLLGLDLKSCRRLRLVKKVSENAAKRYMVEKAVEAMKEEGVCRMSDGDLYKPGVVNYLPLQRFLDFIYPLETPKQKRIREVREKMEDLAEELRELENGEDF